MSTLADTLKRAAERLHEMMGAEVDQGNDPNANPEVVELQRTVNELAPNAELT